MQSEKEIHDVIMKELIDSGVTVNDIARAWASMDRKDEQFDLGKEDAEAGRGDILDHGGHYAGYICDARELLRRAIGYALRRENKE
jgi:hypothetical protein